MTNETQGNVEREIAKEGLVELVKPEIIVPLLKEIKKVGRATEGKLGKIYYGDNLINYQNLMYEISVNKGHPLITVEDKGRCPAYSQTIGNELFNQLFGYNLKGDDYDRRPSFENITWGFNRVPLTGIYIDLNKGLCPFDLREAKHRFSRKSFERFVERLRSGGYIGAVESITDMFDNVESAVTEFLSQYRGISVSLVKENGVYVPEREAIKGGSK